MMICRPYDRRYASSPPGQLNSSDDDRAACQTCQTALFPPALLSMVTLGFRLGLAGGSSRGQRLFAVILFPKRDLMRWMYMQLVQMTRLQGGITKCAEEAGWSCLSPR